tara:strand:- start:652 stop:1518 length:867 start_codon:yes stop_codon:yes gene_type:complete
MAEVTTTTAAVFIPEIWQEAILDYAERQFRLRNQVTEVSDVGAGDVLHIPRVTEETAATLSSGSAVTFGANTDGEIQLSMDKHIVEGKRIGDLVRVQSSYDLFNLYTRSMGYAVAKKIESEIASLMQTASGNDVSLSTDNTFTTALVRSGLQKLLDLNVDYTMGDTFFYTSPAGFMSLASLGEFSDYEKRGPETGGEGPNITGMIKKIYGMEVYASTDWDDDGGSGDETATIFTRDSILYAEQFPLRVQQSYNLEYLATELVVDQLVGVALHQAANAADCQIVNFNNP